MSIQSSLDKIDQQRLAGMSPRTVRLKLGLTERQATAAGIAPSQGKPAHPVTRRSDFVIERAKEFGLRPAELDAYYQIAKAATEQRHAPTQAATAKALQTTQAAWIACRKLYSRLERAGLIQREVKGRVTTVTIAETGEQTWIVSRNQAKKEAAA